MPRTDMPESGAKPGPEGSPLPGKKLDSWGEIASYLGREVRTVQRWERAEDLPVHRHEHKKKSTVYAYTGELDAWFKRRQPKDDPAADAAFVPEPEPIDKPSGPEINSTLAPPAVPVVAEPRQAPDTRGSAEPRPPVTYRSLVIVAVVIIASVLSYEGYRWVQGRGAAREKVRIVVLPFTYLSGDAKLDYITAGLTDVIRTKLCQLDPPHLGVIAATSSVIVAGQTIPDIGRVLNVKYVLEGSVQRAGNQVRIDVQLIQVSDQTHLWADSFTRELSDVLQVENDVSAAIARQVLATLPMPPPPQPARALASITVHASSPEIVNSRHAYHQARFAWGSRGDLRSSITFYEQAIHDDPTYAEAYAGLAGATAIIGQVPNDGMPPREANPKAKEAAQRALQLKPRLAEAHAVLGNVAMSYDWDLAVAEKELRRAIELNPNDPTAHEWYAQMMIVEGRNPEALVETRRALDLDPVSPIFHSVLAETYYYGRAYDAAIEEAQQVVKLHPDFLPVQFWLGSAFREKKMYLQAIETFQKARDHAHQLGLENPALVMAYGHAQALAGNAEEARNALHKLEQLRSTRFVPSLYMAAIHVGLGETDEAFHWLDLAYQEKIDRLVYLNVEPMSDPIRSDPRFAQLMSKIGLH
jgi:TolB-like protein/Tfp pilus assembly protein PilF